MGEAAYHPFGVLLRRLRVRAGLSQNRLALTASIDSAYVNRLEAMPVGCTRTVSRRVILELADALEAGPVDRERLLVLAGLCPEVILHTGWDASLGEIAEALADPEMAEDDRAELRSLLRIVAARWRKRG